MVINAINTGFTIIVEIDPFSKERITTAQIVVMKAKSLADSTWNDAGISAVQIVGMGAQNVSRIRTALSKGIAWAKFLDKHLPRGTQLSVAFTQDNNGEPVLAQPQ